MNYFKRKKIKSESYSPKLMIIITAIYLPFPILENKYALYLWSE